MVRLYGSNGDAAVHINTRILYREPSLAPLGVILEIR